MYNFADSSVTASAFTSGANTALTLVATTAGLTTTAALVIYFDDQATSSTVTGTVELGPTSLNALESITVTMGQVTVTGGLTDVQLRASAVTVVGTVTVGNSVTISSLPAISGTVTIGSAIPAGTNRIGVVTIGAGTVTIGAGTAQIGSVTAGLAGWELLGQRDFFADGSNWAFSASTIGLYSSIGLTFGDSTSGSIQATYVPANGQDNDVYWTSQDGSRVRIITSGSGLLIATALPAILNIAVNVSPSSNQTASLYGKKDNTVALTNVQLRASAIAVSGSVTIGAGTAQIGSVTASISNFPATQPVSLTTLPALVAGTAQIGSVTASISGTVPVSGTFFQATQPVSLTTLPALVAGTAQIGSVTASISGTVPISISSVTVGNSVTIASLPAISGTVTANLSISSTAITSGSFTSLTSAALVPANTARKMATVYNLGAGQLFVNAGATATTLGGGFMVALSSGDFYECDYTTTTLSAIFATAGTASWVSH
jgi:hypothetical protein